MSEGNPFPHIDRVTLSGDLHFIFRQFMITLERLQSMDDHAVLYIAVITNVDMLSFISADGGARCDKNQLADRYRSNHRGQRMDASRSGNDWLSDVRVECGGDVGRHPADKCDPDEENVQAQADREYEWSSHQDVSKGQGQSPMGRPRFKKAWCDIHATRAVRFGEAIQTLGAD